MHSADPDVNADTSAVVMDRSGLVWFYLGAEPWTEPSVLVLTGPVPVQASQNQEPNLKMLIFAFFWPTSLPM